MASYTCAWIPMTSMRPSAEIITRHPLWRELLMGSHTLATSPSWMPTMDTGQSSLTRSPACLQHSTVLSEDTISCDFPLASSVPKTSSRRRWLRSSKSAKDALESQMTSLSMVTLRWNMMPAYKTSCRLPTNMIWCLIHKKNTHEGPSYQFLWLLLQCQWCPPRPGKVDAIHALPVPTNITKLQEFLGLVTYLSPFIPGLSTLTASPCELLKKDTDFNWNCTYHATFQHVKEVVVSDTTLRYFNPSFPMTIQVDASQVGLSAALLQNGKPVAFASKALTKTKCQYANIERC